MTRKEVLAEGVELWLGDCRDVLQLLGPHDALCTDPPYGIEYSSGTSNRKRGKAVYSGVFEDTRQNIIDVVIPAVRASLELCGGRGVVTPGSPNLWLYPEPDALGGFYQPAALGMNKWGFANLNPVCFYGKDPRAGKDIQATVLKVTEGPSSDEHPCAKPLGAMKWMVSRVSEARDLILDPFMGSGTTGVAAVILGRKFTGIELDEGYFDTACRRIEAALREPDMFIPIPKPSKQQAFI